MDGQASEAERLLGEADEAFVGEDFARAAELARKAAKRARKEKDPALEADALAAEAGALNQLGEPELALVRADEALRADETCTGGRIERGYALFGLCRFEEARFAVDEVLQEAPDEASAHHLRGLLAERRGESGVARRAFSEARRLAPEDYPRPPELSENAFDAAVEDALERLPPSVRDYLSNVPISVEPIPSDDDLRAGDPPLSPSILGVFRGAPYGQKGAGDPWSHFPSSIVLYQRNLERIARDREELVEEIDTTLVHEVGHFLGLDEEELAARGLD